MDAPTPFPSPFPSLSPSRLSLGVALPLILLFSFLTAPVPPHSVPRSYVIPTTTLYPGPLSYLSSPNVFIVAFFPRDSSPFAVCPCIASSLPRALRTKRALLSAHPGSVLTSVLLFLRQVGPFAFARARICFAIIHYVFCTFCAPRSFSLFPRFYQRASFSRRRFPFPASSDPYLDALASFLSQFRISFDISRIFTFLLHHPLLSLLLFLPPLDIPL